MDRDVGEGLLDSQELGLEWRTRAADSGWSFPSDWHVPAVDAVCDVICAGDDVWAAAERLGKARAAAGVSLGETLADVDGLCAIVHPRYTPTLRRAISLGWADRIAAPPSTVSDPLTGLVTREYLTVRLGEIYRAAEVRGGEAALASSLLVVRLDLEGRTGWQRMLPMILTADAMRCVFDGGQSLAQLGDSVAVVLAERDVMLPRRARLLTLMIASQLDHDPQATIPAPGVWIEPLPTRYGAALSLVGELSR